MSDTAAAGPSGSITARSTRQALGCGWKLVAQAASQPGRCGRGSPRVLPRELQPAGLGGAPPMCTRAHGDGASKSDRTARAILRRSRPKTATDGRPRTSIHCRSSKRSGQGTGRTRSAHMDGARCRCVPASRVLLGRCDSGPTRRASGGAHACAQSRLCIRRLHPLRYPAGVGNLGPLGQRKQLREQARSFGQNHPRQKWSTRRL